MASNHDPEMQDEYDFSAGVRGKYAARDREGTNRFANCIVDRFLPAHFEQLARDRKEIP